jgi:sulfur-oxidizing protein SoxZ
MATSIRSRLTLIGKARPGEPIEARWIVGHPMETGFRVDDSGRPIARNIITQVRVLVNGKPVLEIEPGTGLSSQPYIAFTITVPPVGGTVVVEWHDDKGDSGQQQQVIVLEP